MPTINDVAKLAGVSIATVSCCINGTRNVKPETKAKIQEAIDRLNFVPNSAARILKTSNSKEIGVILPDIHESYYIDIFKGISKFFQSSNYYVNVAFSDDIPDKETNIIHSFQSKNINGAIIITCQPENTTLFYENFIKKSIPVVFLDREVHALDTNFMSYDNKATIYYLTSLLIQAGKRDIGLISGPKEYSCEFACIEGYSEAMKDNELPINDRLISIINISIEDAFRTAIFMLQQEKVNAIITSSESIAKGVLMAADLRGISVPEELTLVSLGQEYWNKYNSISCTLNTLRSAFVFGEEAAKLLLKNINSPLLFQKQKIVWKDRILDWKDLVPDTNFTINNHNYNNSCVKQIKSAAQSTPIESVGQSTPIESAAQSTPIESVAQSTPIDSADQSIPIDSADQSIPIDSADQSIPIDSADQSMPIDSVVQSTPIDSIESTPTINILMLEGQSTNAIRSLLQNFISSTGIEVNIETCPHTYLLNKITSEIGSAGNKFDIFMYDIPWLNYLASSNYLEEITAFINSPVFDKKAYIPENLHNCELEGKFFGVPTISGHQILFFRKDLFENRQLKAEFEKKYKTKLRSPRTWVEFNGIAEFFTKSINPDSPVEYGTSISAAYSETLAPEILIRLWAFGGRIFDAHNRVIVNSVENIKALKNFIKTFNYTDPATLEIGLEQTVKDFCNGKTAMLISYISYTSEINDRFRSKVVGKVGYDIIPGRTPIMAGWNLGISPYSLQKEAAYKFLKWTSNKDINFYYTILQGQSPLIDIYKNEEMLKLYPWISLLPDTIKYCELRKGPYKHGSRIIPEDRIEFSVTKAVYSVLKGICDAEEALKTAQSELMSLFESYGYKQD